MGKHNLFADWGAHVMVDGQFGSTGKGAVASFLALRAVAQGMFFHYSLYSGGPNSGHTFYDMDGNKHVLKQLPTFGVAMHLLGEPICVYLTAGAVIDIDILVEEALRYPTLAIVVHPNAAIVREDHRIAEMAGPIAKVAGTRSGTGEAQIDKIRRYPEAVIGNQSSLVLPNNVQVGTCDINTNHQRVFVEVSQGFSLGINSQFYPKVTSRECTVMQGIADARIPPRHVTKTYMVCRTYPIRVGNIDGFSSGYWYPDQREISWEDIGVAPELTTVTQRVRRVATWSRQQFRESVDANDPDFVFVNFINYMSAEQVQELMYDVHRDRDRHAGKWFDAFVGYGPRPEDFVRWEEYDPAHRFAS